MLYLIILLIAVIILWSVWGLSGSRVEQMDYTVVKKMNGYEIREYSAHIEAQTTVKGTYGESLNRGFGILAGYIFGRNTKRESIAMTAPVVAKAEKIAMTAPVVATTKGSSQTISFGMPRAYTLKTLPQPDDARVKLVSVPAKKFAVIRFAGYRTEAQTKSKQAKLLSLLARDRTATTGSVAYAGYNPPWTPPWLTRHEVLVEVKY